MKRLIKNRKGTAEVIGTIMFIVILLFFFTNVYLWHDAATKEANQLYLEKINSTFKIEQTGKTINITADGGSDISLSRLWIVNNGANEPNTAVEPYYANLGGVNLAAGMSFNITFENANPPISPSSTGQVKEAYSGDIITVYYVPSASVTCTVVNTLGVAESTTFQP